MRDYMKQARAFDEATIIANKLTMPEFAFYIAKDTGQVFYRVGTTLYKVLGTVVV